MEYRWRLFVNDKHDSHVEHIVHQSLCAFFFQPADSILVSDSCQILLSWLPPRDLIDAFSYSIWQHGHFEFETSFIVLPYSFLTVAPFLVLEYQSYTFRSWLKAIVLLCISFCILRFLCQTVFVKRDISCLTYEDQNTKWSWRNR